MNRRSDLSGLSLSKLLPIVILWFCVEVIRDKLKPQETRLAWFKTENKSRFGENKCKEAVRTISAETYGSFVSVWDILMYNLEEGDMDRRFERVLIATVLILIFISILETIYIFKLRAKIETTLANKDNTDYASLLVPYRKGRLWGFAERSGKVVIEPQFEDVWFFTDGLAKVRVKNLYGFIDVNGDFVIEPQFENVRAFSEGRALFSKNGLFGYIDTEGKVAIPPQFENALDFREGLAPVKLNGLWGYIDTNGRFVIEPQYSFAGQFENGIAHVGLKGKDGFIDKSNRRFFED